MSALCKSGHRPLYSIISLALPMSLEHLTAGGDRLGRYLREGDDARGRALVHPVMDGAPLHQHVASLEVHAGAVELHVDLARDHCSVIDRIGAVVARGNPGAEAHHPEDGAVVDCGDADFASRRVCAPVVVDRKAFTRPDHGGVRTWPRLHDVLGHFVDRHDRAAVLVMACHDAADCEAHGVSPSAMVWGGSFAERRYDCKWVERPSVILSRAHRLSKTRCRGLDGRTGRAYPLWVKSRHR